VDNSIFLTQKLNPEPALLQSASNGGNRQPYNGYHYWATLSKQIEEHGHIVDGEMAD
jgi:hypothetical protein